MDHLPFPSSSRTIQVPFLAIEEYEGGDFFSYPDRKGWDVTTWRRRMMDSKYLRDFNFTNGRPIDEALAFLQTWLCLGLLQCCLNREISLDAFSQSTSDGGRVWTNERLEEFLQRWQHEMKDLDEQNPQPAFDAAPAYVEHLRQRVSDIKTRHEQTRELVFATALNLINEALTIASVLDWYAKHKVESGDPTYARLQGQVFLIRILQDALCSANRKIHRPGLWHGIHNRYANEGDMSSWLERHFKEANWCPHTIHNIGLRFDDGVQAYAFALGTVRRKRSHVNCTSLRCVANQLNEYGTTKHRRDGCACKQVKIDISEVVKVLKNDRIPVFTIERSLEDKSDDELRLKVEAIEPNTPYLAVSHVWADGLANPLANQLPACQLKYLRHVVDLILMYKPHPNVKQNDFEGLKNVPIWFDGLCIPVEPEHQALRDFSISKMREIYDNSTGVIVFDPDIQCLPSSTTNNEILMRLLLSGWSSRLWTFQECALAFDTFLVGDDCVFNLLDIRRDSKIYVDHDNQLSVTISQALSSRLFRAIILPTMSLQLRPQMAYQRLLAAISGRSTSRPNDETVVLASFLDMDTNPIIQEPTPQRRMIKFMQMLPFIPPSIVFAWGPRLCVEDSSADWGWIPATLLAPYGVDDLIVDNEIPLDLSKPDKLSDRPASYIHPAPEHGLATFFPGILITHSTNNVAAPFTISTPSGRFIVHDAAYDYSPTGTGRLRPWTFRIPGLQSAIILSSFNPSYMRQEPALLVHYTSHSEESTLRRVFMNRVVRVTTHDAGMYTPRHLPIEDADASGAALEGELINPTWWLINPFPADYEKEKRHWLSSLKSP